MILTLMMMNLRHLLESTVTMASLSVDYSDR